MREELPSTLANPVLGAVDPLLPTGGTKHDMGTLLTKDGPIFFITSRTHDTWKCI
jgi:hypothetical protein